MRVYVENESEALPGVAYPGVRDNHSTLNTKTGYDDDDEYVHSIRATFWLVHNATSHDVLQDFLVGQALIRLLR